MIAEGVINYASVTGVAHAGGLIADREGEIGGNTSIKNCANYGTITCTDMWTYMGAGGFFGRAKADINLENCVNYGIIKCTPISTHTNASGIGTVFGYSDRGTLNAKNIISVGAITPANPSGTRFGAIGGRISSNFTAMCYYYKIGIANSNFGLSTGAETVEINVEGKDEAYLKSQAFVNKLNGLIETGKTTYIDDEEVEQEVTIDTTGYAKWKYNAGDYPTLDLTTKWDGEKWVKQ